MGFTVPAAHLVAMTALRRRAGRPTAPSIFGSQVMGTSLSWYERRDTHVNEAVAAAREEGLLSGELSVGGGGRERT